MSKNLLSFYPLFRLVLIQVEHTIAVRLMLIFDIAGIGIQGVSHRGGHLMLTVNFWKIEAGFNFSFYDSLTGEPS